MEEEGKNRGYLIAFAALEVIFLFLRLIYSSDGFFKTVHSSEPEGKHPTGDMFACEECNVWAHLNCYVEFKDFSNDDLANAKIYCRKCRPSESLLFNVCSATLLKILGYCDFQGRRSCMLLCNALCSLARSAESTLKVAHNSPDVALHLLSEYQNLAELTLFCWHTRLGKALSPNLRKLTLLAASPNTGLGAIPRGLESLSVHDSAVTDAGIMTALGRGGRSISSLKVLNLTGTSVTGAFPHMLPDSLQILVLCSTPTNDGGLFESGICSLDGNGTQRPNLRHLDLSHTLVTNGILKHLPRKLTELNLSYCSSVTIEGLISWLSGATRLNLERLILLGLVPSRDDAQKIRQIAPKTLVIC